MAIALPVLGIVVVGALDAWCVVADRTAMQSIADATALNAAAQLLVDNSASTAQRAQAAAQPALNSLLGRWNASVDAKVVANGVQVTISGNRPSLILGLLPSNGWSISVSATAQSEGMMPLCALGIGSSSTFSGVVVLQNSAQVTAPNCLVQSDQNLDVEGNATVTAGTARAVGEATGSITPSPQSGAPIIADPFAALSVTVPTTCTDTDFSLTNGSASLPPGVHCGAIRITGPSTVTLLPGTHYFHGAVVTLTGQGLFQGSDVTMVFDAASSCSFTGNAGVKLQGASSGPLAGFVFVTARDNTSTFTISTTAAHVLEGVIYLPNAQLSVPGYQPVAEASAWTVIVAKSISVSGTANLTLNTNYSASSVPVPTGVGVGGGNLVLTR